ncbi:MAG: hypothetical protein U0T82_03665 [Bacteroidales bacterium]
MHRLASTGLLHLLNGQVAAEELKLARKVLKISAAALNEKMDDPVERGKIIDSMLYPASIVAEEVDWGLPPFWRPCSMHRLKRELSPANWSGRNSAQSRQN